MDQKNKFERYYIGLDVGTNSVGWAVADADYNILRHKGQDMWGVHLFDEANSAAERRGFRTARRRRERQVNRIAWVRELMKDEINAVDPDFFQRLEDSKLHKSDRRDKQPNTLFNDANYTDRDFHREFPTAYHLRNALMKQPNRKFDIRLIYLAIAHIMKSRGNFLYQGSTFDASAAFDDSYRAFTQKLSDVLSLCVPENVEAQVQTALQIKGIKRKTEELQKIWSAKGNKALLEIIKLLAGGKAKLSTIFTLKDDDSNDELVESLKAVEESELKDFSFSKADYDENTLPILESVLDDNALELFEYAKKIYDWSVLSNILGAHASLSEGMIAQSLAHRHDLAVLKHLVRKYAPNRYADFFKNRNSLNNYQAWIGNSNAKNNKSVCDQKTFYDAVKGLFKGENENAADVKKWIMDRIDEGNFLNKLRINSNGVIPYQLHLMELEQILANASNHYAFLNQSDDTGLSVKEKIIQTLKFRIPYYVGPLSDKHLAEKDEKHGHAWIVRNPGFEHKPIRPWNFEKAVNLDACGEAFIRRMTAKCSYLPTCDVLPKQSLLYSEYMVLNQLNNLKIDGKDINRESKTELFELCKNKKTVGKRDILNALNPRPKELGGFDGDLKLSLKSYHDFKDILGEEMMQKDRPRAFVEDCITACTIFGEATEQLIHRIHKKAREYQISLTDDQIKRIARLKYKNWGKFSREFLTEIDGYNKGHGECYSIREALECETDNLMQLLSKNYSFVENIDKYNKAHGKPCKFTYESLVKELYCSPAVKRAIWRTLVIVKDILRVTKHAPARIFVEMARDDGEKKKAQKGKRTKSRRDQLLELYKNMKTDKELDKSLKAELEQKLGKYTDDDLRKSKDRLYLYFTQCGRCMYSGERIDLDKLLGYKEGTIWDIDHIYPQSKVIDNSLDNRVLVKKDLNNIKQDRLPLECGIVKESAKEHWKFLLANHFISKEKYERLTRKDPLKSEDLAGFINRQLVETRQTTKAVCETLRNVFGNDKTTIVYSHAGRVSEFRRVHTHEGSYEFVKCREVNDLHHAKDAYLNIVVGNVFHTKFTGDPKKIFDEEKVNVQLYTENNTGLLQHEIKRYDPSLKTGISAWNPSTSLKTVKRWMASSRILFTRFQHENTTNGGGFYNAKPLKGGFCGDAQIPLKTKVNCFYDCKKYGGYNSDSTAYFILVDFFEGKHKKRAFKPIPTRVATLLKELDDKSKINNILLDFCKTNPPLGLGLVEPHIVLPKILIGARFIFSGFIVDISGTDNIKTFQVKHGAQLILPDIYVYHIKRISTAIQRKDVINEDEQIRTLNCEIYNLLITKFNSPYYSKYDYYVKLAPKLSNLNTMFAKLDITSQSIFVLNALSLFSCTKRGADLSILSCGGEAGKMTKSMDISKFKKGECIMVHSSPTGLSSHVTDLMKL